MKLAKGEYKVISVSFRSNLKILLAKLFCSAVIHISLD